MTKSERLVLTGVVVVNIAIYLVVIVLAWDALAQSAPVEEIVVGYSPAATPVAVAGVTMALQADPPTGLLPTLSLTPSPTLPPPALACPPPAGWGAYFVRSGDTLFSLARNYHLTVDEVKATNCLPGDLVQVEQILFLPLPTPTPVVSATEPPTASPTPPPNASPTPTPPPTPTPTPTEPPLPATAPTPVPPLTMDAEAVNMRVCQTSPPPTPTAKIIFRRA